MTIDIDELVDVTDSQMKWVFDHIRGMTKNQLRSVMIHCATSPDPHLRTELFDAVRKAARRTRTEEADKACT
jgi:hypothetical protein